MKVIPSHRLVLERQGQKLKRKPGDPHWRRLRIFANDPFLRQDAGGLATLQIPYEQLQPGPVGARFQVDMRDPEAGKTHPRADLERPEALIEHGYAPSMSRREFAGQMSYAVAMSLHDHFVEALGRDIPLGLREGGEKGWQGGKGLRLQPFAMKEVQALFEPSEGAVKFGYHAAEGAARGYSPDAEVYSCLSHDIVVHELSHGFLHALRPSLIYPMNADVLALHEAFADLIAVFQRLRYDDFVVTNIQNSSDVIDDWDWLAALASNYSSSAGIGTNLRKLKGELTLGKASDQPHDRGLVLVQAVFEAFTNILKDRFAEVVLLASGGTGILPEGRLAPVVVQAFAREMQKVAGHIQTMLIRAFDFIPPIGPRFGDFLRALITADTVMVPSDDRRYRMHFIEAFRKREIFPTAHDGRSRSLHMTEDGLRLPRPDPPMRIHTLSFSSQGFSGDPASPDDKHADLHAKRVGSNINTLLGDQANPGPLRQYLALGGATEVEMLSLRSFRKLRPAGDAEIGTVVELGWRRRADTGDLLERDGALILTNNVGEVTYVIAHDSAEKRYEHEKSFQVSKVGQRFWQWDEARENLTPRRNQFGLLCSGR